ncbi:sugar transferase [Dietzia sp. DQ12-76]|nr:MULTISPECIES: sugar transferase [unclassified Dietzia]MBB1023684.1 sugar transferase [Dietzia sp. DQ12-76]MBB1027244.1 sugar transferase [Dietzia sp. DQ11-38-2]
MSFYTIFGKRAIDIAGATAGLLISSPITLAIAASVKAETRGPVFYRQQRVGRGGAPFGILKFRSMLTPADSRDIDGNLLENYARVTKVGRFLRRFSLDELPQLVNILVGEMSIVGPRPTLQYQVDRYSEVERRRLDVRPGLTGLAQVSGRNSLTWGEKIAKDLEYVDSISLLTDLRILVRTFAAVLDPDSTDFVAHDNFSSHNNGDSSSVWNKQED